MIIYRGVTQNGCEYAIDDDCMAPRGSDEERRIIEEQQRIAYKILMNRANNNQEQIA